MKQLLTCTGLVETPQFIKDALLPKANDLVPGAGPMT